MIAGKRVPWDNVCFHAQQAAEKILKAFLVYDGQVPQKTHDCVSLLVDCATINPALSTLEADCRYVTRFGVAPRYPDIAPEPTKKQAIAAVAAMHRIRTAVLALLPK
ncbi:MAG: HEPN domain-containing protein [Thermomicrobiales bacterium]